MNDSSVVDGVGDRMWLGGGRVCFKERVSMFCSRCGCLLEKNTSIYEEEINAGRAKRRNERTPLLHPIYCIGLPLCRFVIF